jgi:hypothetical protein
MGNQATPPNNATPVLHDHREGDSGINRKTGLGLHQCRSKNEIRKMQHLSKLAWALHWVGGIAKPVGRSLVVGCRTFHLIVGN